MDQVILQLFRDKPNEVIKVLKESTKKAIIADWKEKNKIGETTKPKVRKTRKTTDKETKLSEEYVVESPNKTQGNKGEQKEERGEGSGQDKTEEQKDGSGEVPANQTDNTKVDGEKNDGMDELEKGFQKLLSNRQKWQEVIEFLKECCKNIQPITELKEQEDPLPQGIKRILKNIALYLNLGKKYQQFSNALKFKVGQEIQLLKSKYVDMSDKARKGQTWEGILKESCGLSKNTAKKYIKLYARFNDYKKFLLVPTLSQKILLEDKFMEYLDVLKKIQEDGYKIDGEDIPEDENYLYLANWQISDDEWNNWFSKIKLK